MKTAQREHMYTDAELEHWGRIFVELNLYRRGYDFESFMQSPHAFLDGSKPLPLLRKQRAVKQRIDGGCQSNRDEVQHRTGRAIELHGDRLMQPLHRRAGTKRWKTRTHKRRAAHV